MALPPAAAAILLAAALTAAACGGADDGSGSASRVEGPTATAAAPSALTLESFHYVASLTLQESGPDGEQISVSTEGDFQAPDRHAFTYLAGFGSESVSRSAVVIGDRIWVRSGAGDWRAATPEEQPVADLLSTAFSTIRPGFLGGPEFEQVRANVRRLPSNEEFVNDVAADHYRVAADDIASLSDVVGTEQLVNGVRDLRWELWLARDGAWPVRLLATGNATSELKILSELGLEPPTTWELRVDISRPNDPGLVVAPPDGAD